MGHIFVAYSKYPNFKNLPLEIIYTQSKCNVLAMHDWDNKWKPNMQTSKHIT